MNSSHHKWIWALIIIIVLVVIASAAVFTMDGSSMQSPASQQSASTDTNISAVFTCDAGKSINATFINATTSTTTGNQVMLSLSDGRQMTLPQVISADGARYANADQSFIFWNVGTQATVWENGTTTFTNCVTSNS